MNKLNNSNNSNTSNISNSSNILNILTIDVEEYFQVENLKKVISDSNWSKHESRVRASTDKVLKILAETDQKATFFVLGWVAEKNPNLIKRIVEAGHEIASHGYSHKRIFTQTKDEFREDVRKSKRILENIMKKPVIGYRAPTYSVNKKTLWALDVLREEGFEYDSSIFPLRYDRKAFGEEKRYPYKICPADQKISTFAASSSRKTKKNKLNSDLSFESGDHSHFLWEFPISSLKILNRSFPFSGGGYFRLLPYRIIKRGIEAINKQGAPAIVYMHPWEIDPKQPRFKTGMLRTFRHYHNLRGTESKLKKLLGDFKFISIKDYIKVQSV